MGAVVARQHGVGAGDGHPHGVLVERAHMVQGIAAQGAQRLEEETVQTGGRVGSQPVVRKPEHGRVTAPGHEAREQLAGLGHGFGDADGEHGSGSTIPTTGTVAG